jgi:hypothetical protein
MKSQFSENVIIFHTILMFSQKEITTFEKRMGTREKTNKRNRKSELITAVKIDVIVRKICRRFFSSVI